MSTSTGSNRPDRERAQGEQRLDRAVGEQASARVDHEAAKGTAAEMEAAISLRAADEQVAARERWLDWVGERDDE